MSTKNQYTDVTIQWKDSNEIEHVTFADKPENNDSQVFYTGLNRSQLLDLVGKDFGEDFIIVSVD